MSIPSSIISIVSKVAPTLGTALGGPAGSLVGSLISSTLGGVDMKNEDEVKSKIECNHDSIQKLKELELQFKDLKSARDAAENEKGAKWWFRAGLVILAYLSLFVDVLLIYYLNNALIRDILVLFTGVLILDIRQMHKLYFGSSDTTDFGSIFTRIFKKY